MALFKLSKKTLKPIKEKRIDLEKTLQSTIENNLEEIFGLKFVSTEFALHNFRIDTLAYDEETKSFVIIEYKKDKSISIVDQGYSYLSLMLNNKADFILEYNQQFKNNLNKNSIDWSQSRIVFIASSFTVHQRNAINFRDLPIELFEAKLYEDDILSIEQLKPTTSSESIKTISKSGIVEKVSKEIKKYTIEDHFKPGWEKSRELFEELRERILELEGVTEKYTKHYIAFEVNGKNITEIVGQKQGLKIYLDENKSQIKDPEKIVSDCSKIGHWATGSSRFHFEDTKNLDYAMFLIKQVWERFGK